MLEKVIILPVKHYGIKYSSNKSYSYSTISLQIAPLRILTELTKQEIISNIVFEIKQRLYLKNHRFFSKKTKQDKNITINKFRDCEIDH